MKQLKKIRTENRGAALIVTTMISLVLIVFTTLLMLVAYSLFISVDNQLTKANARSMADSVSHQIQVELVNQPETDYPDLNAYQTKIATDNSIYGFIRNNLGNGWKADVEKTLALTALDDSSKDVSKGKTTVTLSYKGDGSTGTILTVMVESKFGDEKAYMTSTYKLQTRQYPGANAGDPEKWEWILTNKE